MRPPENGFARGLKIKATSYMKKRMIKVQSAMFVADRPSDQLYWMAELLYTFVVSRRHQGQRLSLGSLVLERVVSISINDT